jgi:hypothetical protein
VRAGRLHCFLRIDSDRGEIKSLTLTYSAWELRMNPEYLRWSIFIIEQWLALPEAEQPSQLFL